MAWSPESNIGSAWQCRACLLALIAATLKPVLGLSASFGLYCVSFQLLFKYIGRSKTS
jgi:hypothetical protein